MFDIFKQVDKFFTSTTNYLTYNYIFMVFVGLFLLTTILVIYFTSRSYEARLIKSIDHLNSYFIDNPQINEDNLVSFNAKMKSGTVPKQLRKAWQQFVLYREGKASTYMSFENCVATPIKNSTYTRDIKTMNILAWIFSLCSFILNAYYCFDTVDFANVLRSVLLTPIIILLINYVVQIFLNLRHHAIISDLFQNYQYFETNIDKATETLPEYVDYEVLFDRNEIKKGIPILYSYLQKRAEEEQRQLELARLKNVEHEKFNFDDQGIAASLVLERAMHEAENYIAERKKYMQDIEQINSDMTQEDMNYREITKEYNRQMQVSKETFANFKSQLEEASSSIEANYLKKQQQQELDRQRNLERDFDTATERHKKVIEGFNAELDSVDKLVAESRKNLEEAMKSEFATYSGKVYDEAKIAVDRREKDKTNKFKTNISNLEETLIQKNQELENLYAQNQLMSDKLLEIGIVIGHEGETHKTQPIKIDNNEESTVSNEEEQNSEYKPLTYEATDSKPAYETEDYSDNVNEFNKQSENEEEPEDEGREVELNDLEQIEEEPETEEDNKVEEDIDEELLELKRLLDEEVQAIENSTSDEDDSIDTAVQGDNTATQEEKKKPGRPRKVIEQTPVVKRGRGRPRKEVSQTTAVADDNKRGRGRPRKEVSEITPIEENKKVRGRPKKNVQEIKTESKKKVGRPRKEVKSSEPVKQGRGRPRKESVIETAVLENKRGRGRPKKDEVNLKSIKDIKDIDQYLKEIDNQIAVENAKLHESEKELDKKSKITKR